jgi:sensor histidine kinase YesM
MRTFQFSQYAQKLKTIIPVIVITLLGIISTIQATGTFSHNETFCSKSFEDSFLCSENICRNGIIASNQYISKSEELNTLNSHNIENKLFSLYSLNSTVTSDPEKTVSDETFLVLIIICFTIVVVTVSLMIIVIELKQYRYRKQHYKQACFLSLFRGFAVAGENK